MCFSPLPFLVLFFPFFPLSINISRYRKWFGIECFTALLGQPINILVCQNETQRDLTR